MTAFHLIFQRISILIFSLSFVFVSVYVPQPLNKVETAEAAFATRGGQFMQNATALLQLAEDALTSAAVIALELKENFFDPLAWSIAKVILSQMTADIVNWINRGFEGSPMFVQDIRRYILETADVLMGSYLQELGGLASFVCAPFRVDIQVALNLAYTQARRGHLYGTCTLSGALANIDNFLSGSNSFFGNGGWEAWYGVTSRPQTHTPYGSLLNAEYQGSIRIRNAQGHELRLLSYAEGFISNKICNVIFSAGANREECIVSTPGQVIEEALTFQLSSGPRSLIAADEINEMIGALFAQLALQALDGTAGLLGLTSDSGYTQPIETGDFAGETFADGLALEQKAEADRIFVANLEDELQRREAILDDFETRLNAYEPAMATLAGLPFTMDDLNPDPATLAQEELGVMGQIRAKIAADRAEIELIRAELAQAVADGVDQKIIQQEFNRRVAVLYDQEDVEEANVRWDSILGAAVNPYLAVEHQFLEETKAHIITLAELGLEEEAQAARDTTLVDIERNIQHLTDLRAVQIAQGPQAAVNEFANLLPVLHTDEFRLETVGIWIEIESAAGG